MLEIFVLPSCLISSLARPPGAPETLSISPLSPPPAAPIATATDPSHTEFHSAQTSEASPIPHSIPELA